MLLKANEFEIGDYDEDMNCIVVNNLHCVGIYKTKERALEVLDEIQNFLERTDFEGNRYYKYDVYQMPEK